MNLDARAAEYRQEIASMAAEARRAVDRILYFRARSEGQKRRRARERAA